MLIVPIRVESTYARCLSIVNSSKCRFETDDFSKQSKAGHIGNEPTKTNKMMFTGPHVTKKKKKN